VNGLQSLANPPVPKSKQKPWPMSQFFKVALSMIRNRARLRTFYAIPLASQDE